jgi:CrcB protein
MLINIIFVGAGGAIGAILRYLISIYLQPFTVLGVNISTFSVNLIGCFLLGLTSGLINMININSKIQLFLTIGIYGALTTFSTFSKETFELIENDKLPQALVYLLLSVIFGIVFYYVGKISAEYLLK